MCIAVLGWEQSGGESAPAVAGLVYRLWARRSAGARPESVSLGVRGQEQGRHVRGSDGTGGTRWGQTRWIRHLFEYRHQVDEARHGLGGALRGRSPRTREGRIGPTAQNCSGQWSVVRGCGQTVLGSIVERLWFGVCLRFATAQSYFGMRCRAGLDLADQGSCHILFVCVGGLPQGCCPGEAGSNWLRMPAHFSSELRRKMRPAGGACAVECPQAAIRSSGAAEYCFSGRGQRREEDVRSDSNRRKAVQGFARRYS